MSYTIVAFADTNIVVHAYGADASKIAAAEAIVGAAMRLEARYRISYWDALILAAALASGCDTLYSEDLQNGQVFEGQLKVVNPFAA